MTASPRLKPGAFRSGHEAAEEIPGRVGAGMKGGAAMGADNVGAPRASDSTIKEGGPPFLPAPRGGGPWAAGWVTPVRRDLLGKAAQLAAILVLWYLFFRFALGTLLPVVVGVLLAVAVERPTRHLARWLPRWLASLASIGGAFALLLGTLGYLAYRVAVQVTAFVASFDPGQIPLHLERLVPASLPPWAQPLRARAVEEAAAAATALLKVVLGLLGLFPELVLGSVIALLTAYLVSLGLPAYWRAFLDAFDPAWQARVQAAAARARRVVLGYVLAQGSLAAITFALTLLALARFRQPYGLALSAAAGVSDLIPLVGSAAFFVPCAAYLFLAGKSSLAWSLVAVYALVGALRRVVEAKVVGQAAGMTPLAALVAMLVGLKAAGFLGVLFGPLVWAVSLALVEGRPGVDAAAGGERSPGGTPPGANA